MQRSTAARWRDEDMDLSYDPNAPQASDPYYRDEADVSHEAASYPDRDEPAIQQSQLHAEAPDDARDDAPLARVNGFLRTAGVVVLLVVAGAGTAILWHSLVGSTPSQAAVPATTGSVSSAQAPAKPDAAYTFEHDPHALAAAVLDLQTGQQKMAAALAALQTDGQAVQKSAAVQQAELKQLADSMAALSGRIDALQRSVEALRPAHPALEARKPPHSSGSRPVANNEPGH